MKSSGKRIGFGFHLFGDRPIGRLRPVSAAAVAFSLMFAAAGGPPVAAQSAAGATGQAILVQPGDLDRWPGPARIKSNITPLEVTIQNRGSTPVLLALSRLRLVGRNGEVFRALPLFHVKASTGGEPQLSDPFEVRDLKFETRGFRLAPTYRVAYRGIPIAEERVGLSPDYYKLYDYYSGKPLPTTGMRRRGIPEGIIDPGGEVKGYLFFEDVSRSAKPVTLHYEIVDPTSGASTGSIQVAIED